MQAVIAQNILIKMACVWRFNPSVHRAKGDRLVRARMLPVCDNGSVSLAPNCVRRCLACVSGFRRSQDQEWVVSRCNRAKNGATVLTLWYKLIRGETGLAASTHWLKFVEIGVRQ